MLLPSVRPCSCPHLNSICGASGCESVVTVMGEHTRPTWSLLGLLTGYDTDWVMKCGARTLSVVGGIFHPVRGGGGRQRVCASCVQVSVDLSPWLEPAVAVLGHVCCSS